MSKTKRIFDQRDGKTSEGSCKKDYRRLTNKHIRNQTRKILKSKKDLENISFPSKASGKKFIWSIW